MDEKLKRVRLSLYVDSRTMDWIRDFENKMGKPFGRFLDALVVGSRIAGVYWGAAPYLNPPGNVKPETGTEPSGECQAGNGD